MKTLLEINADIQAKYDRNDGTLTEKEKMKLGKEVTLLIRCRNYFETVNPTKELIERDIESVKTQLQNIENGYEQYLSWNPELREIKDMTARKAKYNTLMNKSELTLQLKTLQYLLS